MTGDPVMHVLATVSDKGEQSSELRDVVSPMVARRGVLTLPSLTQSGAFARVTNRSFILCLSLPLSVTTLNTWPKAISIWMHL